MTALPQNHFDISNSMSVLESNYGEIKVPRQKRGKRRVLPYSPKDENSILGGNGLSRKIGDKEKWPHPSNEELHIQFDNEECSAIEGEISQYTSSGHMFSQFITQEELNSLPLVVHEGSSAMYYGKSLDEKISQLRNRINSGDLLEAFKQIPLYNNIETQHIGATRNNLLRNRYRDVLPYDSTRVVLNNELRDYINASHIRLSLTNQSLEDSIQDDPEPSDDKSWFVATQTPLESTTADFWTMVWQQRVKTIILLSDPIAEKEKLSTKKNQRNQVQFWPTETGECVIYGEHKIEVTYSQQLKSFHIFKLHLHSFLTGTSRNLTLLLYTNWNGDSVTFSRESAAFEPTVSAAHEFIRFCNYAMMSNHDTSPLLVTCQDGIGRSGVFISLVQIIKSIEIGKEFQLEEIVRQMREWRPNMLHDHAHYDFLAVCALELLQSLRN